MRNKSSETGHSGPAVFLAWVQGIYYAVSGIWPILSIETFMMITGPKNDIWLVHTVGALLIAVGAVLCLAAYRRNIALEVMVLGAGAALALAVIEVVYVLNGTIGWVYLLDAALEVLLIITWLWLGRSLAKGAR